MDEIKWDKRMETLNENWEASRPLIFKAVLFSQCPDIPCECEICHEEPWLIRCKECSGRRMCPACDAAVHEELLFHDREALLDGSFRHIPPTVVINDDGKMELTSMYYLYIYYLILFFLAI